MAKRRSVPSGSIQELTAFLVTGLVDGACPAWPADLFALTGQLLRASGAYVHAIRGAPFNAQWAEEAAEAGQAWRSSWSDALGRLLEGDDAPGSLAELFTRAARRVKTPRQVTDAWGVVVAKREMLVSQIGGDDELSRALIRLCAIADETSFGVGLTPSTSLPDAFIAGSERLLVQKNAQETLCWRVSPDKLRVLPKQHTPQRGINLRSLSHNLALVETPEVRARWLARYEAREAHQPTFNMLLLPWPLELAPTDFRLADAKANADLPDGFRFFEYRHENRGGTDGFKAELTAAMEGARAHVDQIDGVVFPELSLNRGEYLVAEQMCIAGRKLLVAGVNLRPSELDFAGFAGDPNGFWGNAAVIQPTGLARHEGDSFVEPLRSVQLKHHRWCLDRPQILQYGLGGVLPATRDCWERSHIGTRTLQYVTIGNWLTMAVLICEDLARQDPLADVIRAVGPNLVIALLLDGPQVKGRWGSRYASVLAEDPGSSVLTITSRGMCRLSQPPPSGPDRSRVIALWRDRIYGEQEIELHPDAVGCVLSLACQTNDEYTADGRSDQESSYTPVFAGVQQVMRPKPAVAVAPPAP
jgi:hypothetical protein